MTLTLSIDGASRLDNGAPGELVLHRRGAVVGRAATCDWPLPDPTRHLSSRHFEVRFDGVAYTLVDSSTNGTILVATGQRLVGTHSIADGDRFQVGPYLITAQLSGSASVAAQPAAAKPAPAWQGWDHGGPAAPTSTSSGAWSAPAATPPDAAASDWSSTPTQGWDTPTPRPDAGGRWQPRLGPTLARADAHRQDAYGGDASQRNGLPPAQPASSAWVPTGAMAPPPTPSTWETAPAQADPASGWSSAAPDRPAPTSPDDLWGRIAEGNVVDWARGGFGQPVEALRDPLGLSPAPAAESLPVARPVAPSSPVPPPPPPPPSPPREEQAFVAAVGLDPARIGDPDEAAARGAALLRQLVAGLVVMMEARARAKAQLGAEATAFNPGGHNPLKFARTPDEALAMLIGPPQPGFMPADRAVEDAFRDLQSHQVATLKAMQGALRATLERFSPTAIRARANAGGVIERIVPAARDAALWQAYERDFSGVAQGSDEAFLDTFAKEFRQAYNDQARLNR